MVGNVCRFCDLDEEEEIILENENFVSLYDKNPVNKGHALIIPRNHILSFFDMNGEKGKKLQLFLRQVKKKLDEKFDPDAYNIYINDGEAAGRTVDHLHVHLIPRYEEDEHQGKDEVEPIV